MKTYEFRSPTVVCFPDLDSTEVDELTKLLSYKDPEIEQQLKRLGPAKARQRYADRYGRDALSELLADLKSKLNVSLLKLEGDHYETLSGFVPRLKAMGYVGKDIQQPEQDGLSPTPYASNYRQVAARYYQDEAVEALWAARHAAISLPTGSGKTLVIEKLVRRHGVKTVVMTPSRSIASQIYDQFVKAFGKKYVGMFGDGKKESKRQIVVGIAASLTRVEGEHAKEFAKVELFIADESHLVPATTFGKVCTEVLGGAAARYFVSATQLSNKGMEILLEGITGPVVYQKTLESLVAEGFLAKPRFLYMESQSPTSMMSQDWHRLVDKHIYSNPQLAIDAAALANKCRSSFNHPVLILIDEIRQFKYLLPHLKHEVGFAHGALNADNKGEVDERFQKSDVDALVAQFNDGKLPILVGTSCITTGTDLRPTGTIIYLMASASEIKFMQAVGRGTRLVEGKTAFNFIDFAIKIPEVDDYANVLMRHFKQRQKYCEKFGVKQLRF